MDRNFYIDQWLIQPSINKVSLGDNSWKLEPKIMAVLVALAENNGELVTRDALLETIWKDTVVIDMVVTRAVSELRSVFKNDALQPPVIETIPKKGYRLVSIIKVVENQNERTGTSLKKQLSKYALFVLLLVLICIPLYYSLSTKQENIIADNDYIIKPLTSLKGWEYNPNVSYDGKSVVFVWKDDNNNYSICIKSLKDESVKTLIASKQMYFSPIWSKDKNIITYYKNNNGKVSICTIPTYGGQEEQLLKTNSILPGLSWSADGNTLAYVDKDSLSNKSVIDLYDVESQKRERLIDSPETVWGDATPRFSLDGKSVAFVRSISEGNQDIYTVDLATKEVSKVTALHSNIYGFDWKNDTTIVFSSNFEGTTSLWEIDLLSKKRKKIPIGNNNQNPTIRNTKLVLEQWTQNVDLWEANLSDVNKINPLISSTKFDFSPSFSTDEQQIAFVSNRTGSYELWMSDIKGENLKKMTSIGKSLIGNPKWSPDDKLIAFDSKNKGKSNIYFKNINDKDLFTFTDTIANEVAPSWSKDGHWLYFSSDRNNTWEIWKKSVNNGGRLQQVTTNGGYYAQEAIDGKSLYYSKFSTSGIWQLDFDDKTEEKIIDSLSISDYANWKVVNSGIYYVKRNIANLNNSEIVFYNFDDKSHVPILKTSKPIPTNDNAITVSSENKILFSQANGYDGDLIFIENF